MARFPEAEWLGEHSPQETMDRHDIVCVHTIVGFAPAHAAHFSTHPDGRIQQSRDTRYRSGANADGNHRVIAVENEDHGDAFADWSGSNVPRLTDAQVTANAKILAWAHETHGVPLQLCPDSKPGSRGLAYHRQGIDGNFGGFDFPGRVSGGEIWTETFGKVCPGDRRISQLPEILRRAKAIVQGEDLEDPMRHGDENAGVRSARRMLRRFLRDFRDDDGNQLDQDRDIDAGRTYDDDMRQLVRYLQVRLLGMNPDTTDGKTLYDTQLIDMEWVTRASRPRGRGRGRGRRRGRGRLRGRLRGRGRGRGLG
jgi:hypothetical protein